MHTTEIETKIREMIVERLFLNIPADEIAVDASLTDDYGIDSVCLLELVVGLEEVFGIRIEDQDFNLVYFRSVAALRDFVINRLD